MRQLPLAFGRFGRCGAIGQFELRVNNVRKLSKMEDEGGDERIDPSSEKSPDSGKRAAEETVAAAALARNAGEDTSHSSGAPGVTKSKKGLSGWIPPIKKYLSYEAWLGRSPGKVTLELSRYHFDAATSNRSGV